MRTSILHKRGLVFARRAQAIQKVVESLESRLLLSTGLVAAYSFDEGTGTTIADASNTGNNGVINGATWTTAGKFGNALSFNGTSNSITVPDSASLHLTNGITLEAWVRPARATGGATVLAKNGSGLAAYSLYAQDGTPPGAYVYVNGDTVANGPTALPLNAWTHLASTYDGASLKLYVNGTQVGSHALTGNAVTTTGALVIGTSLWGEYFNGLMDNVRIYNRALAQAEIQTDMNTPVGVSTPDTTAPTVAVTSPATGATVSGSTTVTATASDNVGVAGVQFLLDGAALGAEDTAAPYAATWDTTTIANGQHVLTARARDAAGNATTSAPINVTVSNVQDVAAPTVALTAPADQATVSGTAVPVSATASDDVGVVGVQFKLDGVNLGAEDTTAPYSVNWNTTSAANGPHALTAVARDAAGHVTTSSAVNVSVANTDTTAPTVALSAPASGATVTGAAVAVAATASDNVGVAGVQFLLDGNPLGTEDTTAPYGVTWDSTTVANGQHTLAARARDAAGNVTTSSALTVNVSNTITNPATVGQWSAVTDLPIVAMNVALLKNGKLLMWDGGPTCIGATSVTLYDPATNTSIPVPSETQKDVRDLFCSAQTVLADGRVLVAGGHECVNTSYVGAAIGNIFDPTTNTWTKLPNMAYRRWYPTATTLPDGRALVTAGSDTSVTAYIPIPEIYDPVANTWTKVSGANKVIPNYPFMFVLPDGRLLAAGSDEAKMGTFVLNLATQTWSTVDATILDAGSAVMYAPGKIMKAGSSYLSPPADNGGSIPSSPNTYVLDMTAPTPAWKQTQSMANARTHLNLTVLPDGNVLATGGSTDIGGVNPASAVYAAELWNPTTQTWTTMSSEQRPRMYHSTATLLPDGRVFVAGGGHNYYNNIAEFNSEIFSPAYLFKGARPTVSSSPDTLGYNSDFFVGTPDGARIASVCLIRNGATTHSFNMDQRRVPLTFQQTTGGLTVHAPVDANTAPPGTYMLFIVDSNGVPSIAPFVRLPAASEDHQAPTAPSNLVATPSIGSASLTWGAATDNIAVTRYDVYRSTVAGFTPSPANRIAQVSATNYVDAGLASGTYYYLVTAEDAAGNIGPASNSATATVTSDTTAPTVSLTSPVNGATVSGTITLAANASDNVGVAGVQFFVDGVAFGAEDTTAPYSVSWNSTSVSNGVHTITARARDAANNVTNAAPVSVTVSNVVSPVGLIGSWGFDDASGTTATDSSGHAYNGVVSNATWTTTGKYGGALAFNGVNGWVTVADNNALDLTTGMTLEAWVKPNSLSGWTNVVMKERTGGLAYALYASDDTNNPPAGYINRGSDINAVGVSPLALGTWTHLATTYDGANLRLYVNGVLVRTRAITGSIPTSTNPLRIGGDSIWGEYFDGLIDEVRVYNRALSQAEVQTDMNTPITTPGTQSVFAAPELAPGSVVTQSTAPLSERRRPVSVFNRRAAKPSRPPVREIAVTPPRPVAPTPFNAVDSISSLWHTPSKKSDGIRALFN